MYLFNSYKEFYVTNLLKFVPFIFFRSKYIIEPSIMRIENLEFGRFSFGGCNPEIEVLKKLLIYIFIQETKYEI
jgi:hypothetical protein